MDTGIWIRFWCDHGGGHQSHDECYKWFQTEMDKNDLEDIWTDWVNSEYWHNCEGGSETVEALPESVLDKKIKDCTYQIEIHETELKRLQELKKKA